jgi:hypothetical protein
LRAALLLAALRHAPADKIPRAQSGLRGGKALLRRLAKPINRLSFTLRHALSAFAAEPKVELGDRGAPFGQRSQDPPCGGVVFAAVRIDAIGERFGDGNAGERGQRETRE